MTNFNDQLIELVNQDSDQQLIFDCVSEILRDQVGYKLFTILGFQNSRRMVSRLYSSDPVNFPVGGFKALGSTEWGAIVLQKGEVLIAKNKGDLRRIFPDHTLLLNMGLGSAVNIPIKYAGQVHAMLNMLDVEGFYNSRSVHKAERVAELLGPVLAAEKKVKFYDCARE